MTTDHHTRAALSEGGPWMLVGVDGSEESSAALQWAATHSSRFGAVVPATAWRYPPWALGRPPEGDPVALPEAAFIRHAEHRASSVLRRAQILDRREHLVEERAPGPMLVANSAGAELLVVGSRARGQVPSAFASSVSGYCITYAPVPVAVVPLSRRPAIYGRVVVGMDESPEARAGLEWALRHANKDHEVHVVYVAGVRNESTRWLHETITEALASVDGANSPKVVGRVSFGPRAETLALAAVDADMLIVGERGRGRIGHAFLGSVTTSLCRKPSVVTVVIPSAPV